MLYTFVRLHFCSFLLFTRKLVKFMNFLKYLDIIKSMCHVYVVTNRIALISSGDKTRIHH